MALDRRVFIKFAAGGVVGTMFTPIPWKLADDVSIWTQNWPWIPKLQYGEKGQRPALAKLGNDEYGITINTIAGRPVTATGNPNHPLSMGGIDPLAAASVELLYSPARIQTPLVKQGGKFKAISWKQGKKILLKKLQACAGQTDQIMAISGDQTSSANEVFSALLNKLGSKLTFFMPTDNLVLDRVWQDLMSGQGMVNFDLKGTDFVLCVGADLLDNYGTAVRNQKLFAEQQFKLIYAGPVQNQSAAVANHWIPVHTTQLTDFILALAYQILAGKPGFNRAGLEGLKNYLQAEYTPKKAQQKTNIAPNTYRFLAKMILAANKPLILAGSPGNMGAEPGLFYAALALNILLGRLNQAGGLRCIPDPPLVLNAASSPLNIRRRDLVGHLKETKGQTPKLLLLYECNPFYALPSQDRLGLKKIEYKVSFSTFMDESAALADLILPTPHFLERYDDSFTPFGAGAARYSITTPVTSPKNKAIPAPDLVLGLGKQLGLDFEVGSFKELLKSKAGLLNADFKRLCSGQTWSDPMVLEQSTVSLWNAGIEQLLNSRGHAQGQSLSLTLIQKAKLGFPRMALTAFGLKTIFDDDLADNLSVARLNSRTAKGLGLKDGDLVKVTSRNKAIKAKIKLDEGVMDQTLTLTLGLGHTAWDDFAKGKGDNALQLAEITDHGQGFCSWESTQIKVKKI